MVEVHKHLLSIHGIFKYLEKSRYLILIQKLEIFCLLFKDVFWVKKGVTYAQMTQVLSFLIFYFHSSLTVLRR